MENRYSESKIRIDPKRKAVNPFRTRRLPSAAKDFLGYLNFATTGTKYGISSVFQFQEIPEKKDERRSICFDFGLYEKGHYSQSGNPEELASVMINMEDGSKPWIYFGRLADRPDFAQLERLVRTYDLSRFASIFTESKIQKAFNTSSSD